METKQYYDNETVDLNEHAKELVEKLVKLHHEMEKYKNANENLAELGKRLLKFIEETENLSKKSSIIIENSSKINITKIDQQISEFNKSLSKLGLDLQSEIERKTTSMDLLSKKTIKCVEEHVKTATLKIDEKISEIEETYQQSEEKLAMLIEKGVKKIIETNSKTSVIKLDEQISELKEDVKKLDKFLESKLDEKFSRFEDKINKLESNVLKINKRTDDLQMHNDNQFEKVNENIKKKKLWN